MKKNFNGMKLTKKNQRQANSERRSLSVVQKAEICRLKEWGVSQVTIAKQFKIADGIVSFLKQQSDGDFTVDNSFIRGLGKLKKEIVFKRTALKKQSVLDTFVYKH